MDKLSYAKELIDFIDGSPCATWAAHNAINMLKSAGFEKYNGELKQGGKYYFTRGNGVAAVIVGSGGLRIGAAHLDSPALVLKPAPELISEGHYVRLNCEVYGGAILSTWLDRPLGIAGRVAVESGGLMPEVRLYKSNRPLCIVPNCAPHLNREINSGFSYNKQRDMLPIFSLNPEERILDTVAAELGVLTEDILDCELYCYEAEGGCLIGEDMLSCGRLDDLMMSYALLRGICEAEGDNTSVVILTDNEEVGSLTMGGARGGFAYEVLKLVLDGDLRASLEGTVAISADMAHAVNPSHPELHEPVSRPYLNCGMTLKRAADKSYSTDEISGAAFKHICRSIGIEYQEFLNPSDKRGGTTIGPMLSAALGIHTADIGAPLIAMHSIRELGGTRDALDAYRLFKGYFEL